MLLCLILILGTEVFLLHGVFFALLLVKKSYLLRLMFPFLKVKSMLVWLTSPMTYLLILLLPHTCPKGEVANNVIINRQE